MTTIDLNCDMGESFGAYTMGSDQEILEFISSSNIACGFHAGDPTTMRKTVKLALEHGVALGAHPGLADLIGFGRRNMAISSEEAFDIVTYQIGALQGIITSEGGKMNHVKAHGALYNMAAKDAKLAEAIAEAVYRINPELVLFGLAGSEVIKAGEKLGLKTGSEVFADRSYQEDGSLTNRRSPNALITDPIVSSKQVLRMIQEGKVMTEQGVDYTIKAETVCIHGDGVTALQFARELKAQIEASGVKIQAIK